MLRWARSALPLDQEVLVLADQGLWSPRRWPAIRSQQFHPIMRVRTTSTFAPTGQARQSVLRLAPGPGLKGGGFAGRLSTVSVPPNARADPSVS